MLYSEIFAWGRCGAGPVGLGLYMTGKIVTVELQESDQEAPWNWCCLITATWEATEVYARIREIDAWCTEYLSPELWKRGAEVWSFYHRLDVSLTDYRFLTQDQATLFQLRWNP